MSVLDHNEYQGADTAFTIRQHACRHNRSVPPPVVVTNHKQVSAVIESAVQHPNLAEFYTHVSHEFSGVLRDTVYACDIDPAIRGPFDV